MCVYSMVVDHYNDKWQRYFQIEPHIVPTITQPVITDAEISEFRELLDRARRYDRENNQPDCELESKKAKLRELAKELGIEDKISFV